uniref:Endosome-associated-trafficking regulator 1 n=1 Tax=Anopheles atroparvus TaxID=41427 RepID=A0A182IRS5_ANOAO
MAKDNNNINTDDLTDGGPSSSASAGAKVAATATSEATGDISVAPVEQSSPAPVDPPVRREENPFSFKHFLKWDGPVAGGTHYNHTINGVSSTGLGASATGSSSINHSRSTSNINGHGSSSTLDAPPSSNGTCCVTAGVAPGCVNAATATTITSTTTGSPSKSATTSSLNVVSSTTGARPKIPQFQSVNTLSSESKMKRSPRFPSFDSQSSLSDFADERFGSIYQSRSNSSFSSDYPPGVGGGGGGSGVGCLSAGLRGTHSSNGGEDAELLGRGYVPRSYSNYDLDSPGSAAGSTDRRHEQENDGGGTGGRLVGATEFSAALPDFVQDHLVMEQWYTTLPKGGSGGVGAGAPSGGGGVGGGGSGSSGSVDFDDMFELAGVVSSSGVGIINDMPFDLTASSTGSGRMRAGRAGGSDMGHRNSPIIPLDLPPSGGGGPPEIGLDLPHRRVTPTPSSVELPPDLTEGNAGGDIGLCGARSRPYYYSVSPPPPPGASSVSSSGTADKIHRLPDFLSDGPIHSSGRLADVTHDTPHGSETAAAAASDHRHRLQQRQREAQYQSRLEAELSENERLRRELDLSRQTVVVQARRIRELERDLESMVSSRAAAAAAAAAGGTSSGGNGGSTQSNANSFMQAKSRAATAEAELKKLRQKMSSMSVEMETLRRENEALKEEVCGGAIGGSGTGAGASVGVPRDGDGPNVNQRPRRERSSAFLRAQTIALRQAASSAENNLRQLLSGVENLRTMANQIESFSATAQAEEIGSGSTTIPLEDYLHGVDINSEDDDGDDEDDALGPAL